MRCKTSLYGNSQWIANGPAFPKHMDDRDDGPSRETVPGNLGCEHHRIYFYGVCFDQSSLFLYGFHTIVREDTSAKVSS